MGRLIHIGVCSFGEYGLCSLAEYALCILGEYELCSLAEYALYILERVPTAHARQFSAEGLPLCQAGFAMPLQYAFTDRTSCLVEHERGKYVCPLRFPTPIGQKCPVQHKRWKKGGCTTMMPTSIGTRLRYTLDRDSVEYKDAYRQRTAIERINSQAVTLGIERPHLRSGKAIANQNTLIYLLINLRFLQRLRQQLCEHD